MNAPIDEARVYKAEDDDSATEILAEENKVSEKLIKKVGITDEF